MSVTFPLSAGSKGCQPTPRSIPEGSEQLMCVPTDLIGTLEAISAVLYAADDLNVEVKRSCLKSVALLAKRAYSSDLSGNVYPSRLPNSFYRRKIETVGCLYLAEVSVGTAVRLKQLVTTISLDQ